MAAVATRRHFGDASGAERDLGRRYCRRGRYAGRVFRDHRAGRADINININRDTDTDTGSSSSSEANDWRRSHDCRAGRIGTASDNDAIRQFRTSDPVGAAGRFIQR